ncbi:MAG: hypothetical protein JWM28_1042 [Chitinophagaceae bacterium]|nr:hypothetical protein [Chitinophagaceae bacterium]
MAKFFTLSTNESDASCLDYLIHWYTEANKNAGYAEGAIILIQNALELLYNWQVVEKTRMIIDGDADNLSASNKIRLLLSTVLFSDQIPKNLESLTAYVKKYTLKDGPAVFTDLRNALVHSQESKRKRLSSADVYTRSEAVTLGLTWIENVLLKLNYEGLYLDRNRQIIGVKPN